MNLIEAIKENNQEEFFRLLNLKKPGAFGKFGKKVIDEVDGEYGGDALYWASFYGRVHFIDLLLKAGAHINKQDKDGSTPVYKAAENGHAEVIAALKLAGANMDTPNGYSQTPVFIAASNGHAAAITALAAAGANVNTSNLFRQTPVYRAAENGRASAIIALLDAGADVSVKTRPFDSALQYAKLLKASTSSKETECGIGLGRAEVVKVLKAHLKQYPGGVKPVGVMNKEVFLPAKPSNLPEHRLKPAHLNVLLERVLHSAQCPSPLTFLYSNLASILPKPIIGLIQEYYVIPKEVAEFLKLVAEGEQDKAEAMLKSNPALALVPGDVTDLSKRTFTNITGFQYAVWALDWHMWTMIRKYLPPEEAQLQAQGFETGSWIRQYGVNAQHLLEKLVNALQTSIDLYNTAELAFLKRDSKMAAANTAWVQQVGGAQLLLPAHVINEYCHPTRSFYPLPNFKAAAALPRVRDVYGMGEWFTAVCQGGRLGDTFVVTVVGSRYDSAVASTRFTSVFSPALARDGVRALTSARTAQREELIAELRPKNVQRKAA